MTSTPVAISLRTRSPLTVLSNSMSSMKVQVRNRDYWIVRLEKLLIGYTQRISAAILDQGIPSLVEAYGKRFDEVFPYPLDFPVQDKQKLQDFSRAITSNLLGGVGFFYGNSVLNKKISYEWDEDDDIAVEDEDEGKGARLTPPKGLLTATPSRSFFPRGFYWYVLAPDHHSRS